MSIRKHELGYSNQIPEVKVRRDDKGQQSDCSGLESTEINEW